MTGEDSGNLINSGRVIIISLIVIIGKCDQLMRYAHAWPLATLLEVRTAISRGQRPKADS
ncbi:MULTISPECIES: hypothetical protein [Moorena]|uniref:Uncharacterized protein n=1 Tax=Moorena producens 3L TaxID=489825 RepID=F4XUH5_9CYAN|nr:MULTISPECIES: hypothetical protein [Moorena]NEQ17082.1 hypothetical protein [Moorena sp. SIO3E2]EGJ31800.1 hypothetical protein LYNGBM3L_32940 [Moorena producens 3L]NEP33601.1 hypothetical protein [Moorena sp. SIO3B2]NEP66569.1 hypothetical protein [Moorena sp. SIO3A5]NEQ05643.1 hypothetical protein [Moorena sp. SIO4E2]